MNKHQLTKDHVGARLLVRPYDLTVAESIPSPGVARVREARVLEAAPSGQLFKLTLDGGIPIWQDAKLWEVVEVLPGKSLIEELAQAAAAERERANAAEHRLKEVDAAMQKAGDSLQKSAEAQAVLTTNVDKLRAEVERLSEELAGRNKLILKQEDELTSLRRRMRR